jgi:hypothetical protein
LVGRRELIGTPYLADAELRGQYADEIAPRTKAALGKVLEELYGAALVAGATGVSPSLKVLDLGAGTGAAGETVRSFFGEGARVVSIDRVGGLGTIQADLTAPGPVAGAGAGYDLVVAAHLLNEIFVDLPLEQRIAARAKKVTAWCQSLLAEGGTFVIVEPALRETSRELLAVRDQLIAAGLRVVAPCLWSGPCPALARDRDWCHDAAAAQVSGRSRVDFSYLALRRSGATATDPHLLRIVSDQLVEKGRLRLFGCGPAGRYPLVRLDRHRSASNAAFDRLERGQLASVAGTTVAGDGLRLGPETVVTPIVTPR